MSKSITNKFPSFTPDNTAHFQVDIIYNSKNGLVETRNVKINGENKLITFVVKDEVELSKNRLSAKKLLIP